jgi:hypothetical protein
MNYEKNYYDYINYVKTLNRPKTRKEAKELNLYFEGHHIIPKCVGGEGSSDNWSHPNIIQLTPKEHYLAHYLLTKIYKNNQQLHNCFYLMSYYKKYKISSKMYEYSKYYYKPWNKGIKLTEEQKKNIKGTFQKNHIPWNLNKHQSDVTKEKCRKASLGKKKSIQTIQKLSNAIKAAHKHKKDNNLSWFNENYTVWNKNKKMSKEFKEKCRIANLGRKDSEETKLKKSIAQKKRNETQTFKNPIICVELNKVFYSRKEIYNYFGSYGSNIYRALKKKSKAFGYTWSRMFYT